MKDARLLIKLPSTVKRALQGFTRKTRRTMASEALYLMERGIAAVKTDEMILAHAAGRTGRRKSAELFERNEKALPKAAEPARGAAGENEATA